MRAPDFWQKKNIVSTLLLPFSALYYIGARLRGVVATPFHASLPILCVGNIVAGGAGKTPTCLMIGEMLHAQGIRFCYLTRGYGGTEKGPLLVEEHTAEQVGDEALLLSRLAPTIISTDRADGAQMAAILDVQLIVMDDGMQNPGLHKDVKLVVVDGDYGFGNGRIIPAGPLREPIDALRNANAVLIINKPKFKVDGALQRFDAVLEVSDAERWEGRRVVVFSGIARPEKFQKTLKRAGAKIVSFHSFPDHYFYHESELKTLHEEAQKKNSVLVTTAKDAVKLGEWQGRAEVVETRLNLSHEAAFWDWLKAALKL